MANTKAGRYDRLWVLYAGSFALVAILYPLLRSVLLYLYSRRYEEIYMHIYGFMFQAWPVQFLSTWLFAIGLIYWFMRYGSFKQENEVFQIVQLPEYTITREEAPKLIGEMPDKYHKTLTLRRLRELLQAFAHGEDIIRLNEELSRRDMAEIEQGHSVLDSTRNLIPVLGFLGTVIGLSLGMIAFPDIQDIEKLREALKSFAASLSVAFNTTLLALVYTIIIILLASFLRQREEILVRNIDEKARTLVGKTKVEVKAQGTPLDMDLSGIRLVANDALLRLKEEFATLMKEFFKNLSDHNTAARNDVEKAVKEMGMTVASKLDDLRAGIRQPPHYQILVKPVKEHGDEEK